MGSIDIASMLKQLSEVSRRRDVDNKRRDREKISSLNQLASRDANDDVLMVNFEKNTIKPEDHALSKPELQSTDKHKPVELPKKKNTRLKEDYKANFLDVSE